MPQNLNLEPKSLSKNRKQVPEFDLLNIFVGKWYLDGYNGVHSSAGFGEHVSGEDTYEWSADKQNLQFSWVRYMDTRTVSAEGIILYDLTDRSLLAHTKDNSGKTKTFRTTMTGRTLSIRGDSERAKINVNNDELMTINWEQKTDSKKWVPLCELRGSKNKQIFS